MTVITPSTWQHHMLCGLCAATYSCSRHALNYSASSNRGICRDRAHGRSPRLSMACSTMPSAVVCAAQNAVVAPDAT